MSQRAVYHDLIAAYRQMIPRVHPTDIPLFCASIMLISNLTTTLQPNSDSKLESTRQALKEWICTSCEFDVVVDSDTMVRDPSDFTIINSQYNWWRFSLESRRIQGNGC